MNSDTGHINTINRRLRDDYRVLDGRPIYRVVFSGSQYEMRKSVWREFYGHILIREYEATKLAPKYWYFKEPCWVLEKLVFINKQVALKEILEELVEAGNGTYEPVYVFKDKDENPLPVYWRVVEIILWHLHHPVKMTPSDIKDVMLLEEAAEVEYFRNQLAEGERSELFVFENSAFVSSNQHKFRQDRQEYVEKSKLIEVP